MIDALIAWIKELITPELEIETLQEKKDVAKAQMFTPGAYLSGARQIRSSVLKSTLRAVRIQIVDYVMNRNQ